MIAQRFHPRPLRWIGSAYKDYFAFPGEVQDRFGFQLHLVQIGLLPPSAKPLKGVGSGAVELVEDYDEDTFRAVYTVRFATAVYVLHALKKKSNRGAKTPLHDIALIERRLKVAETDHRSS